MISSSNKVLLHLTLLSVFSLPFIFVFPLFEYPKFVFFVVSINLLAITSLITYIACRKGIRSERKTSLLTKFVLLYIAIVFISNLLGVNPMTSFTGGSRYQGFLTLITGVELYLIIRLLNENRLRETVKKYIIIVSIILSAIGLRQGYELYLMNNLRIAAYHGRIAASFANPNFLGGYLVICLPFILFWNAKNRISFIVRGTAAILIILSILLSGSRGALIAFVFILIIYIYYLFKKKSSHFLRNNLITGGFIVFIITMFIIKDPRLQTIYTGIPRYSIWNNQFIIWKESLALFFYRPLLGYGQETLSQIFPPGLHYRVDDSHNIFLTVLLSSGIIGFIVFLLIITNALKNKSLVVKVSLVALLVRAQFNPLSISEISLFWLLIAL